MDNTSMSTYCETRLRNMVIKDKKDNPQKINGVLKAELLYVLRNYLDLKEYDFGEEGLLEVAILDMGGENVFDYKPTLPLALVVGSEAHGVSNEMRDIANVVLAIPMYGNKIESLNAGVSASIVVSTVMDKLQK